MNRKIFPPLSHFEEISFKLNCQNDKKRKICHVACDRFCEFSKTTSFIRQIAKFFTKYFSELHQNERNA